MAQSCDRYAIVAKLLASFAVKDTVGRSAGVIPRIACGIITDALASLAFKDTGTHSVSHSAGAIPRNAVRNHRRALAVSAFKADWHTFIRRSCRDSVAHAAEASAPPWRSSRETPLHRFW